MDLKQIAEQSLEQCLKSGAQEAKVTLSKSQKLAVDWRKGKVETLSNSASSSIVFSIYANGRYAVHQSSDLRAEALQSFIPRIVELTRLLEPDEFRKLAPKDLVSSTSAEDIAQLQIYDKAIENISSDDCYDILRTLEAQSFDSSLPIIDVSASISTNTGTSHSVHSNGFSSTEQRSRISAYTELTLQDPSGKRPNAYFGDTRRHLVDLMDTAEIAKEAQRYAAYTLEQVKLPSGKTTLLFDRRVATTLISRYLTPIFGSDIQQKRSYFEGKLGKKIAVPALTIVDDPHIVRGLASKLSDGDGFLSVARPVIEAGELKNYFIDYYYSLKLGVDPTTGSFSNLVVQAGSQSQAELIAGVDKGIFVTSFLGGNADRTTGDFSYGIAGVAIEGGKLTQNVSEMNFSGNYNELFLKLSAIGNDPMLSYSVRTPTLRFDDVDVSGA
ncbi:MAG: TldD/PmbA family protein [Bradymonadales bacterium]|jgi:PmbA protein